jgi:hypothetical protein
MHYCPAGSGNESHTQISCTAQRLSRTTADGQARDMLIINIFRAYRQSHPQGTIVGLSCEIFNQRRAESPEMLLFGISRGSVARFRPCFAVQADYRFGSVSLWFSSNSRSTWTAPVSWMMLPMGILGFMVSEKAHLAELRERAAQIATWRYHQIPRGRGCC